MKYYLIAGEASGDLHGSHLMKALLQSDAEANFRFFGGDKMQAVGGAPVKHIRDLAFMGFWEVLSHLGEIFSNLSLCKKDLIAYQPDVVILIDYPGFNFRLLKFLKARGVRVFYYISPQLWAWKEGRVKQVRQYVDKMFVIFPFEKDFYAKHGIEVEFVGHPLLDEITFDKVIPHNSQNLIALLPGSRKKVVQYLLPEYLKVVEAFPAHRFVVAGVRMLGEDFYRDIIGTKNVDLIFDDTYDLLQKSQAALVTSGTATLETALHQVPQVVCYKGNPLSVWLARKLVHGLSFICIVNLIAGKKVVEELIQDEVNPQRLQVELQRILKDEECQRIRKDYHQVRQQLGASGASKRAAELMTTYLKE